MNNYKLVIFDADGTLTPQRDGACGPFEQRMLPGVTEKCAELRADGVMLAIASNQSAARPTREVKDQLAWTAARLGVDPWAVMWATDTTKRKPEPWLLNELMILSAVPPAETLFVGDRETDRQAADAAGCAFADAAEFFAPEAQHVARRAIADLVAALDSGCAAEKVAQLLTLTITQAESLVAAISAYSELRMARRMRDMARRAESDGLLITGEVRDGA